MVYFSTYANPLYFTSDLRQIHYTTNPTYLHVVLQQLNGLVATVPGPLACHGRGARPLACPSRSARPRSLNLM